ncbi:MAG: ATP-grasp domain-containing protein, partial [Candidatus Eremiobacteraeota bacterium]|nr:ATP-grasp domain-containing protein [Candidatus Eremiobacteraeota bacterium]
MSRPIVLCLASFFKGHRLLEAYHRHGARLVLVAEAHLKDQAWPDFIEEKFFVYDMRNLGDLKRSIAYLARTRRFELVVPLEEYVMETAAFLREQFQWPGIGESQTRLVRDKLAMRHRAQQRSVAVPGFVHLCHHPDVDEFTHAVPSPWMVKPRCEGGAVQIEKLHTPQEVWKTIERLADRQADHLLEQFIPGEVYHVDSLLFEGEILLSVASRYGRPPFNVWHEGGVFSSRTLAEHDPVARALAAINRQTLQALEVERGVTHAEFILSQDGKLYFLEVGARVAGANLDRLVEAATGVNLFDELARQELSRLGGSYSFAGAKHRCAGIVVCLSKVCDPDLCEFDDPEIVWRLQQGNHAGLVVAAETAHRVETLVNDYLTRFTANYLAVL